MLFPKTNVKETTMLPSVTHSLWRLTCTEIRLDGDFRPQRQSKPCGDVQIKYDDKKLFIVLKVLLSCKFCYKQPSFTLVWDALDALDGANLNKNQHSHLRLSWIKTSFPLLHLDNYARSSGWQEGEGWPVQNLDTSATLYPSLAWQFHHCQSKGFWCAHSTPALFWNWQNIFGLMQGHQTYQTTILDLVSFCAQINCCYLELCLGKEMVGTQPLC